jgi:NAD(P) transhydrogenase
MRYDLVVIGSNPAGQSAALAAAGLNKRVALIEHKGSSTGKAYCPSGAVSSRILRDAIVHLTRERPANEFDPAHTAGRLAAVGMPAARMGLHEIDDRPISIRALKRQVQQLVDRTTYAMHDQLDRSDVDLFRGSARFARPHEIIVHSADGDTRLEARCVLIACGTKPLRPERIPFDGQTVFDADEILQLHALPESLIVVGAGATGIESAMLLATLGVRVTVVDSADRPLESCDRDIAAMMVAHAQALGMTFRTGEEVIGIDRLEGGRVAVRFARGRSLVGDRVLYAAGRVGDTDELDLAAAGLEPDDRGRLWCDEEQRTWAGHIYGAGDVVGFPVLSGSAAEQGRRAVGHAFGHPLPGVPQRRCELNTIPAIAMAGSGEEQLARERISYVAGLVRLRDESRVETPDHPAGLLKLLFHRESRKLLGIHCIGETAREVVRVGQAVMAREGTLGDFCRQTLHSPALVDLCRGATIENRGNLRLDRPSEVTPGSVPHVGGRTMDAAPELAELIAV